MAPIICSLSEIYPPQKERSSRTMADALYPFECRQAKLTYAGKFMVDMKFQYDDGVIVREKINLGQFPIMLKSKFCHLKSANDPKKLVLHKEEPSETGGCVREDQSAVTVKLYYLNNGSARLGFWVQGREYLLPVGIILKINLDAEVSVERDVMRDFRKIISGDGAEHHLPLRPIQIRRQCCQIKL